MLILRLAGSIACFARLQSFPNNSPSVGRSWKGWGQDDGVQKRIVNVDDLVQYQMERVSPFEDQVGVGEPGPVHEAS